MKKKAKRVKELVKLIALRAEEYNDSLQVVDTVQKESLQFFLGYCSGLSDLTDAEILFKVDAWNRIKQVSIGKHSRKVPIKGY